MKPNYTEIATVVYLLKDGKICLAKKKQHVHTKDGKELDNSKTTWNGYGGKSEDVDKTIRDTAIRELFDESGVVANNKDLIPVGRLNFFWPDNESDTSNMDVYFFFLKTWKEEPKETNEMGEPFFFEFKNVPYHEMLPADKVFLPRLISKEVIIADVFFGKKDKNNSFTFVIKNEELIV